MNKLKDLTFVELDALRIYYMTLIRGQENESHANRFGSQEVVIQYLDTICGTIESKFEDLITEEVKPIRQHKAFVPKGKSPTEW